MVPNDLEQRRRKLRLPKKVLAARARLDETTVGRVLKDGNSGGLTSTLRKLEAAIADEERELLQHLCALHPTSHDTKVAA